ncbi:MAG: glutathione peroxidase [Candidatus Pelagibacterales bacterium]|jgi:glutathione peroxidase|nr:MAG: glutathione peroxidase [Pelagibacterales bacterium]|tara:strand:- start:502 stop:993 length:492 start_codon:yes stop_codon:yes gene_type:complete
MSENAYSYSFKDINEEDVINLSDYKGKTLVVVNTASLCGFTYQYDGLQKLYDDYKDQGLVVLGVPSNDFGNQESGTNSEVKEFCESTFSITFPLTEKNVVKGKDAHPFFKWSKKELGFIGGVPRWNFHKIIIGKDGNAIAGYTALTRPSSKKFISEIEKALQL